MKDIANDKSNIEILTEEIRNLRLELKTSNESIKTLSNTVKTLSENSVRKNKRVKYSIANKVKGTEAKTIFRKGDKVIIMNKIRQHIKIATEGDRISKVTGVSLDRAKGHPNKIFITTDNGFETWRDPSNLRLL